MDFLDSSTIMALIAFVVFMAGAWAMLSLISNRNTSTAEQRLERIGRPKSLADIELNKTQSHQDRFGGLKETMQNLGSALEPQNDLEKNTLVIFTSDNGPWLSYGDHAGSAGPLREGKGTLYEGGTRVPLMWSWRITTSRAPRVAA